MQAAAAESLQAHRMTVLHGDCLAVLPTLAADSVDAVVTDPPAGIGFMGRAWDHNKGGRDQWVAWMTEVARETWRVCKPGAHAFVWTLPRTAHWTAWAWEDAGWEPRDCYLYLFGTGFPKSARVNRDPAFCQCAEPARNDACNSHEQPQAGRTGTEAASYDDAPPREGARRSKNRPSGLEVDYQPACGSDDARARPEAGAGPASLRPQECAPAHTHFFGLEDAPASGSSRSLSRARHSARPSNPGSRPLASSSIEARHDKPASTTPNHRIGSGISSLDCHTSHTVSSALPCSQNMGWPITCQVCGKPAANGYGTAAKPAHEDWWLFRKPLSEPTVAANCLRWGTGALNIDGCRVGYEAGGTIASNPLMRVKSGHKLKGNAGGFSGGELEDRSDHVSPAGRWPANVVHSGDEQVMQAFAAFGTDKGASGQASGPSLREQNTSVARGVFNGLPADRQPPFYGDTGSPARFFKSAGYTKDDLRFHYSGKADKADRCGSRHPTCKPLALIAWLAKLICPPGGTILDPFAGSGPLAPVALQNGFNAILIEKEAEYVADIHRRLAHMHGGDAPLFAEVA